MNNNSNNCGDCGTTCSECGRPWAICKQDGGCGCNKCKDIKFCEYGRMANGCIREKQPGCPMQAVIPSVTVESIEGIKNLADCLVHVSDINTTFYIDDKHRPIITWAGPIDIPGYDMEGNPNNYRDQIVTDVANQTAVIYDKSGNGYLFGLAENLDLQEEVNNKLDEMAKDGTLARIINDELLQGIEGRVQALEEADTTITSDIDTLKDIDKEPLFLSCFFSNTGEKARFYVSRDLKNYALLSDTADFAVRDASIAEYGGYIYMVSTYQTETADFMLRRTKDLVTFEEFPINVALDKTASRWAPSLLIENDTAIVTISLRRGSTTTTSGEIYRTTAPMDTLQFTTAGKITSITQPLAIDSDLFKYNNNYYMLVKNDEYDTPTTHLYKSSDSITFEYVREMTEFPSSNHSKVEGAFGLPLGNKIFIGADNYDNMAYSGAVQLGMFANNIETASKNGIFVCNNGAPEHMRHGYTCKVDDLNLKSTIIAKQKTISGEYRHELLISLNSYATDNVIEDLYIYPNVTYYVSDNVNITINKLHNPFQCDFAHFQFRQAIGTSITIVNNGYTTKNYKFVHSFESDEDDIVLINSVEGFVPVAGYENAFRINSADAITSSVTISPETNEIYRLGSGTYTVTLSGRASKFYLRKMSGATGTATVTDGYFNYPIVLGNYADNSLIEFIHIVNNWFMVN